MKSIKDFNLKNKRVLMRCDFDVPLDEKGNILDDFRIKKAIPTIKYLIKKQAKIILMAHLDKPGGKKIKKFSLGPIQEKLLEYLDCSVTMANDCIGKKIEDWTYQMQAGEILLLENLRFHKQEEENNEKFAHKLANLADIYLNDAFATSHRKHASFIGIPRFLPSGIGLLFEQELKAFDKILKNPRRPLVIIIGGSKIESKIEPINEFLEKADFVLLAGEIANTVLQLKQSSLAQISVEKEIVDEVRTFELTNPKLKPPLDGVAALNNGVVKEIKLTTLKKQASVFDIGPETAKLFSDIIFKAKTIFWSGPLGKVEDERFINGTLNIAKAIIKSMAFSLVGGGDTVSFLRKHNLADKFSYVSTAGGAMLEYLSKGTLPAIEALKS